MRGITFRYEITLPTCKIHSIEFSRIEACIEDCKDKCKSLGVDYDSTATKLFTIFSDED